MTHLPEVPEIVVLDFGGQTAHLIARRFRDLGHYARLVPGDAPLESWRRSLTKAIVLSGSQHSVYDSDAPHPDAAIHALGLPILGICYGAQYLNSHFGGAVGASTTREFGPAQVRIHRSHRYLVGVPSSFMSWMSHGDSMQRLAPSAHEVAGSANGLPAVIDFTDRCAVGLQFHPEVTHSEHGTTILANFARSAGLTGGWNMSRYLADLREQLREVVATRSVLQLVSGGVDSAVSAALLLDAHGADQVHLMYIDTGLMRSGETEAVVELLQALGAGHVHVIDASRRFLSALAGVSDPERKRRIIGDTFIRVQQEAIADNLPTGYLLAQGTLYTDMVESGQGANRSGDTIKTHHNVGSPLVRQKREAGELVEPLAQLYKDEVRRLGRELGLTDDQLRRHPFPGPGLAVRVLGEVTAERCDVLRAADRLFIDALHRSRLYDRIWQAFAVLLPVRSVGVTGDQRSYGEVIALRAITSEDGMTADVFEFPAGFLRELSAAICNALPEVSRVVYDYSGKPPATIEWE